VVVVTSNMFTFQVCAAEVAVSLFLSIPKLQITSDFSATYELDNVVGPMWCVNVVVVISKTFIVQACYQIKRLPVAFFQGGSISISK
jgi:hypothetical protein